MSVAVGAVAPSSRIAGRGRFHTGLSVAFLLVGVIGFAPTYWAPVLRGASEVPPIVHLHAMFFYGWLVFFLVQARLIAAGEVRRHREIGVAGASLATSLLFVGLATAVQSMRHTESAGFADASRAFAIVSVSGILLFAGLVAAAIAKVKKPEVHKRLLVVATASILQAAVGRLFLLLFAPTRLAGAGGILSPPPVAVTVLPGLAVDLLIVAAMIHDRRTTGRVHRTYWIAGGIVLAVQILRVPASATDAWVRVTHWLTAIMA